MQCIRYTVHCIKKYNSAFYIGVNNQVGACFQVSDFILGRCIFCHFPSECFILYIAVYIQVDLDATVPNVQVFLE
jgi:hypothetical protein